MNLLAVWMDSALGAAGVPLPGYPAAPSAVQTPDAASSPNGRRSPVLESQGPAGLQHIGRAIDNEGV